MIPPIISPPHATLPQLLASTIRSQSDNPKPAGVVLLLHRDNGRQLQVIQHLRQLKEVSLCVHTLHVWIVTAYQVLDEMSPPSTELKRFQKVLNMSVDYIFSFR